MAGLAIVLIGGSAAAGVAHAGDPPRPSAFSDGPAQAADDAIGSMLGQATPQIDAAPLDWRAGEVQFTPKAALRIRVGDPFAATGPQALQSPGRAGQDQVYEVSVVHDWPGAVSFGAGRYGFDVSPHAGVGVNSYGGLAEAGATVEFRERMDQAAKAGLGKLGVRDGAAFGSKGRWYLFAAARGRSVGLNMLRSETGWDRAGLTTDQTSTLVGDAQVGAGWRKGPMQVSLGFVHRELKGQHMIYGQDVKGDSLVAFSFSVKPRR